MGSLKDEMRGLREDHKPRERADDGERPGGSDGTAAPEGSHMNADQEATSGGDCEPGLHVNASQDEDGDNKTLTSADQEPQGDKADQSDCAEVKGLTQTVAIPVIHQPEDDETAISNESQGGGDTQSTAEVESIPVPVTPGPADPRSPAPAGQHHMRTQVSLEVVQCCSAATSPMTPPEGGHSSSFFFPSSFGKSAEVGAGTQDAELQVGQQVEFCSVATSPMTPKTPSVTAFPELTGRETAHAMQKSEGQRERGQQKSGPDSKSLAGAESEMTGALKCTTVKEQSEASPESSTSCPAAGLMDPRVTLEESKQQCPQQRMGSMDQDITILVTHHDNTEEEEEGEEEESSLRSIEPEMVKIDECEEHGESKSDVKMEDGKENISTETDSSNANPPQNKTSVSAHGEAKTVVRCQSSEVKDNKDASEELSAMKSPVPESPAPFGCHNIRTQVSLEVVQCQSVATSPMTPPDGDHAFYFPSSLGKCAAGTETKDAELQVGSQVEFRSVATAPMTPRTPTATAFPEISKGASIEEKIVEEEEEEEEEEEKKKEQVVEAKEEEKVTEDKKMEAAEEDTKEARNCKEKCEEPVQEVSWDEKGMTWEVYGAVVEVTVLGSAIQKHLEKQVKKRQPSMPPPPPLNPSAMPLTSESAQGGNGSGKGRAGKRGGRDGEVSRRRRNPFRLMMENMQQPHCCSKAHTTE